MPKSKSGKDATARAQARPRRLPELTDEESQALETRLKTTLDTDVETFVRAYMATKPPEDDDPLDDIGRFVRFALLLPGSNTAPTLPDRHAIAPDGTLPFADLTAYGAACLFAINPRLRHDEWERLLYEVLVHRYGHDRVYLKKRPAARLLRDAKHMTGAELMKAHPEISRSYAYQLRKAALKRK